MEYSVDEIETYLIELQQKLPIIRFQTAHPDIEGSNPYCNEEIGLIIGTGRTNYARIAFDPEDEVVLRKSDFAFLLGVKALTMTRLRKSTGVIRAEPGFFDIFNQLERLYLVNLPDVTVKDSISENTYIVSFRDINGASIGMAKQMKGLKGITTCYNDYPRANILHESYDYLSEREDLGGFCVYIYFKTKEHKELIIDKEYLGPDDISLSRDIGGQHICKIHYGSDTVDGVETTYVSEAFNPLSKYIYPVDGRNTELKKIMAIIQRLTKEELTNEELFSRIFVNPGGFPVIIDLRKLKVEIVYEDWVDVNLSCVALFIAPYPDSERTKYVIRWEPYRSIHPGGVSVEVVEPRIYERCTMAHQIDFNLSLHSWWRRIESSYERYRYYEDGEYYEEMRYMPGSTDLTRWSA